MRGAGSDVTGDDHNLGRAARSLELTRLMPYRVGRCKLSCAPTRKLARSDR